MFGKGVYFADVCLYMLVYIDLIYSSDDVEGNLFAHQHCLLLYFA